jgi:taurine dioxygenase
LIIRPFPGGLGGEVLSFDAAKKITFSLRKELLAALHELLMLLFRDQNLTTAEQVQFTRIFGQIEVPWDIHHKHPRTPLIQIISNAGRENIDYKTQTLYWHSDQSFTPAPSAAIVLLAKQLPPVGGDTLFANMRMTYDALPDDLKKRLRGMRARHSFRYLMMGLTSRRISPAYASRLQEQFPDVEHPLIRVHAVTGEKSLFLNELCIDKIVGMSNQESAEVLKYLYTQALQPQFTYRHKWQPGDLVVWDNTSLMHRANDIPKHPLRVFHRTHIVGTTPV